MEDMWYSWPIWAIRTNDQSNFNCYVLNFVRISKNWKRNFYNPEKKVSIKKSLAGNWFWTLMVKEVQNDTEPEDNSWNISFIRDFSTPCNSTCSNIHISFPCKNSTYFAIFKNQMKLKTKKKTLTCATIHWLKLP